MVAHAEARGARPFPAYRGPAPYVFVCYSHHDTDAVYADMQSLRSIGLRIWYDEGISPGTEWSEELARALDGASLVLFYVTNASAPSRHCRDEINFAHNRDKIILPIYLEDLKLPSGLELSLSSTQAIPRYRMDDDHYLDKLRDVLPPDTVGEAFAEGTPAAPVAIHAHARSRKRLAIAALVAVVLGWFVWLNADELRARWIMFAAENLGTPLEQQIGFAESADGTRIAYGITGKGPPILIVLGWATHLQDGFTSPTYDAQGVLAFSSEQHRVIRYDGRGFGLSDRDIEDWSLEARVQDIEAVVKATGLERFAMYALSAGGTAAITYAQRHPERLVSLTLASTNASFDYATTERMTSMLQMLDTVAASWDDTPAATDLLLTTIFPEMEGTGLEIFRAFIRRSTNGRNISGFFKAQFEADVEDLAQEIQVPTLVIHAEGDTTIPLEAGRRLASLIPGAQFKIVQGDHGDGTGMTLEPRRLILDFIDEMYAREANATPGRR